MQIKSITIVKGSGSDKVMLYTDLPEACYPYHGGLTLYFCAAQGSGQQYCVENFPGIQIEIVDLY